MVRSSRWSDPLHATSLGSGLDVLEAFRTEPAALTNKELARRAGLSPASITRITGTLATRGLVRFDAAGQTHRLDGGALTLANPLMVSLGVRRIARLSMKQVSDELGGTVSLGMRERGDMVYVETSRGNDLVDFRPDVGARLPLLQSAMGRAWLAGSPAEARDDALQAIRVTDPAHYRAWSGAETIARADLARQGYCVSRGDFHPDVHAVAIPLDVVLDGERLVLNCGIPTFRLSPDYLDRIVGPRLLLLARQIEQGWCDEAHPLPVFARAACMRPADDPADRQFARTLARGIDLLQAFQPGEHSLGNGELAERLGLSGSTVARLTHTLTARGYLRRDTAAGRYVRYRLGASSIAVAYPLLSRLGLRELARPAMQALAERVHGAVSLGMRHRNGMVYVETAWRTDRRLIPPDTGTLMPMLASAMGRAWLSGMAPVDREKLLNQSRVQDSQAWSRYSGAALQSIEAFERLGYCQSRDVRPDIEAFAVPLPGAVDGVRLVMNCGVFASSPLPGSQARAVGTALAQVVRDLSSGLG